MEGYLKQKLEVHAACLALVEERIEAIKQIIAVAESSALSETKSSAGDKYETGREMLKQEMEKSGAQLQEAIRQKQLLQQLNPNATQAEAQAGALVVTNRALFYVAVAVGQVKTANGSYIAVSPVSPIALQLLGKKSGDVFQFNQISYTIQQVV